MMAAIAQDAMTVGVVLAGLFFSLACALLVEELVFGAMFRWLFAPVAVKSQKSADHR